MPSRKKRGPVVQSVVEGDVERDVQGLLTKLDEFRGTLGVQQRPLLDAVVITALQEAELRAFVEQLGGFRRARGERGQRSLDRMLIAASPGEVGDAHGYGLSRPGMKPLAMAAIISMGIGAGAIGPMSGSAHAAPVDQPALTGDMGGTGMGGTGMGGAGMGGAGMGGAGTGGVGAGGGGGTGVGGGGVAWRGGGGR